MGVVGGGGRRRRRRGRGCLGFGYGVEREWWKGERKKGIKKEKNQNG